MSNFGIFISQEEKNSFFLGGGVNALFQCSSSLNISTRPFSRTCSKEYCSPDKQEDNSMLTFY